MGARFRSNDLRGSGGTLGFVLPVILENIFTTCIGLVASAIFGGISKSSLAAYGTGNQIVTCLMTLFNVVATGASIRVALLTGKGDREHTSATVTQAVLLVPLVGISAALILFSVSVPTIRILMPNAEAAFLKEGLDYYRMLLLSLPGLAVANSFSSMLRSAGDTKTPLAGVMVTNLVQVLCAYIFVSRLEMGLIGAGISYVVGRYAGACVLIPAVFMHDKSFRVNRKRIFSFNRQIISEIVKIGVPAAIDGFGIQAGYLLINTMMVGLGELEASVYTVIFTLTNFTAIAQMIVNVSCNALVGHRVGAGQVREGRRTYMRIMLWGLVSVVILSAVVMIKPSFFAGIFAKDEAVLESSAKLIWLSFLFGIPAVGVNASEPTVRVGGMGKEVMMSAISCVWLIRVPLTYLMCYPLDMGVTGVYLANSITCYARCALAIYMIYSKKWGVKAV